MPGSSLSCSTQPERGLKSPKHNELLRTTRETRVVTLSLSKGD